MLEQVSWDDIHSSDCTFTDLCALFRKCRRVWLSPNTYALGLSSVAGHYPGHTCHACISHDDVGFDVLSDTAATDDEAQVFFQNLFPLLAKEAAGTIRIKPYDVRPDFLMEDVRACPMSAETLARLWDAVGRKDTDVRFQRSVFTREQCEQLAAFGGTIGFEDCLLPDSGRQILDAIAASSGPIGLVDDGTHTKFDTSSLENALQKTRTLETLELSTRFIDRRSLFNGLSQNKSLIELRLTGFVLTLNDWTDLFRALRANGTLQKLSLSYSNWTSSLSGRRYSARAVVECLQHNTVLGEFTATRHFLLDEPELLRTQIQPRLTENLYRRRVKALLAEPNDSLQRKLMTEAIVSPAVRRDRNLMFFLGSHFFERLVPDPHARPAEIENPLEPEAKKRRRE